MSDRIPVLLKGIQFKVNILDRKTSAMALYPFILINRRKRIGDVTLNHERIHLMQQLEMGILPFYLVYLLELSFKGYRNISFEREAYENERNLNYLQERTLFSWMSYYRKPDQMHSELLSNSGKKKLSVIIAGIIALAGWFGLILQLYLILTAPTGFDIVTRVLRYLSYFTILTNLLATASLTSYALYRGWNGWLSRPGTMAAISTYILVVGIIYVTVLQSIWQPEGAQYVADIVIHYFMPVAYTLYWIIFIPWQKLKWEAVTIWLLYPLGYLIYVLLMALHTNFYPYPFLDLNNIPIEKMLQNSMGVVLVFIVTGLAVTGVNRLKKRGQRKHLEAGKM